MASINAAGANLIVTIVSWMIANKYRDEGIYRLLMTWAEDLSEFTDECRHPGITRRVVTERAGGSRTASRTPSGRALPRTVPYHRPARLLLFPYSRLRQAVG